MAPDELDPLLHAYVSAATDAEAAEHLSVLVRTQALPLATRIATHRLRTSGPHGSVVLSDTEDVIASAMLTLVERIQALRRDGGSRPIVSFQNYTATVVHAACAHLLRQHHPERARLKNRLRYVLSSHPGLALWTSPDAGLICGLHAMRNGPADPHAQSRARSYIERTPCAWLDLPPRLLGSRLTALFEAGHGPIAFDALVSLLADASGLQPARPAEDTTDVAGPVEAPELTIDRRRLLARLWDEVRTLPIAQRLALLLNLRGVNGAGLLWLLPIAGVATLRQVAAVLEMEPAAFARLWPALPLDDESIAGRLGCTRQQVINLRMAARKRLANRVRLLRDPVRNGSGRRANLTRVSTS